MEDAWLQTRGRAQPRTSQRASLTDPIALNVEGLVTPPCSSRALSAAVVRSPARILAAAAASVAAA